MRFSVKIVRLVVCSVLLFGFVVGTCAAKQMAVIVNKANTTQDLSAEEITKIFKCDSRLWASGGAITIVVRDPSSPEMDLLLSRIYKTTPEEMRSFIATHRTAIVVVDSNEAMLQAVRSIPGAIGLIDVYRITQEIKVVKVDGKLPMDYGYILRGN